MTQNEKDLLLKDICARLPYNVRVEYKGKTHSTIYDVLGVAHSRLAICLPFMSHTEHPLVEEVKPYLFPLSDMSKEVIIVEGNRHIATNIDWLNANHLDYRGLIEKGLAIDATGLNIY